ncbi:SPFH domain-containing protein, partial [Streptomyces tropicalis]
ASGSKVAGKSNNGNIAAVQNAINSSLAEDLESTLGDKFLMGLRFNLVRISLPDNVQQAVDKAQAAFAAASEAQAKVAQARAEASSSGVDVSARFNGKAVPSTKAPKRVMGNTPAGRR